VEHYENLGQPPLTTQRNIGICPACSVTLTMEQTLEEEDTLLEAGTIETSEVESKDTLFWLMSTITCIWQMTLHPYFTVASGGRHFVINT
jgi:hypothetical protein